MSLRCFFWSNFRIPRNSFTCHWIRIASIVLCLDLQSLPTHVSEAEMSCGVFWSLAFFFYAVHSRIYGYELLPSLVSARKVTFGSTVSCKWTRQLHHLDFINSSVRLNWGLFRHSISYMASLWRRNTTDTPTLHRINNVCCAVARRRKILPEV